MSGFLDKTDRVIDMILTGYGKKQYAAGDLDFTYFMFFDDEVDYDPYVSSSGSLSVMQLTSSKEEHIEATLVREAITGLKDFNKNLDDFTNVRNPLFTMTQGQKTVPEFKITPNLTSSLVETKQQKIQDSYFTTDQFGNVLESIGPIDVGYEKFLSSKAVFELKVDGQNSKDRFLVKVYESGSEGLTEIKEKRDLENISSFSQDLRILKDKEIERDSNLVSKSNSRFVIARNKK